VDISGVIKSLAGVTQISNNYRTIYVNANATLKKPTVLSALVNKLVVGTGISESGTKIVSAVVVTQLPDLSFADALAITFNKPVSTGDNRFYVVGGAAVVV
jgi:hypothetical protein